MVSIRDIATIAALCSLPALVLAQAERPAADKPAASMKAEAPMKTEAKDDKLAPKPAGKRLTAKSREDARECLSFPTNQEVIICAEKFL
jgi:hypothetical protein